MKDGKPTSFYKRCIRKMKMKTRERNLEHRSRKSPTNHLGNSQSTAEGVKKMGKWLREVKDEEESRSFRRV